MNRKLINNYIELVSLVVEDFEHQDLLDVKDVIEKELSNRSQPIDDVIQAIREGSKLKAIKLHKENTGCGLKEAKEFVDELSETLQEQE